jgi:hypothetical protein
MPDALRISRQALDDVRVLLTLDSDVKEELISALEPAPRFAPASSLVPKVRDALKISNDRSGRILLAILSAVAQVEPPDWPNKRVAEEIVRAEGLDLKQTDVKAAEEFLVRVMELPSMVTSAKASDLLTEYDRIFGDARIVTDIRPVFMEDPHEMANGAVIVSTLKVQYQDAKGVANFYVALDTQDLVGLKKVVDRALSKIDTVKAELDRAGLEYYTGKDGDEAS